MTREEAIKYLIKPIATSTEIGEEKQKEFEAYNMAIEALSADRPIADKCVVEKYQTYDGKEYITVSEKEYIPIVRCKDCRHGWYDDDIEYYTCRHPKGLNEELYGVDFCSYGERREE